MKVFRLSCGVIALCVGSALGQTAPASLTFEVASIKAAGPLDPQKIMSGQVRIGKRLDKARVEYASLTLDALIMEAYQVKSYQIVGPEWISGMNAPRFDIQAKMPEGSREDQIPEMLQSLLLDRFGLKFHKETKDHNIYALVVAKTGLKIKPTDPPAQAPADGVKDNVMQGLQVKGNALDGKGVTVNDPEGGTTKVNMSPDMKSMRMEFSKMPMTGLVEMLTRMVDRPVVDMTGLKGDYQVALDFPMAAMRAMSGMAGGSPGAGGADNKMAEASDPGGSVFESVQKLGLKLEARKGPMETLVIDHLEKAATEN